MTDDFGLFLFLAAGAVSLFAFLSVAHWADTRAAERKALERLALLRKLADAPPDAAALVLAHLREDEARREQHDRVKAQWSRRESRQAGAILVAVGLGLAIFLNTVKPEETLWTLGLIPTFVGLVVFAFTFVRDPGKPAA